MKKLLVLTTLLLIITVSTQAAVVRWAGNLFGGNGNWTNGLCWSGDGGATPYGTPPLSTDAHGLIVDTYGTLMPTISTTISQAPGTLGIGWDTGTGELNVVDGGSISVGQVYMGYSPTYHCEGVLNISGGYMLADGHFNLGYPANNGLGTINQSGGTCHLSSISFYNGVINLSDTALFLIDGDQTGLDLVSNGWITAPLGKTVFENFDSANNRTEWIVIPEPAFLGLIVLGALAFLRKK